MKNVLYLDIEWANPQNKSICQIALISLDLDTNKTVFPKLNLYVNPDDQYDRNCVAVHHISNSITDSKETFDIIWPRISKYFTNSIIIGHNVKGSDLNAIVKNLRRYDIEIPEMWFLDTYYLSRKLIDCLDVENYKLSTLCSHFNIDIETEHDAFDDALACSNLMNALIENYDFEFDEYIEKCHPTETKEFSSPISAIKLRREINELFGAIDGIEMDGIVFTKEVNFLKCWKKEHQKHDNNMTVKFLINTLDKILEDGIVTIDELECLKKQIILYLQSECSAKETTAIQYLHGLIIGIKSDEIIQDKEVYKLQEWLYQNDYLKGHYPYDKIVSFIEEILQDTIITTDEKNELDELFTELFNPLDKMKEAIIVFKEKSFCLSGDFIHGSKTCIGEYIISKGGLIDKSVKKSTNYVVVGEKGSDHYSNGSYGIKVKKAIELGIIVLKENQMY
ncbi:MAG: exonuclease domain-containing protein [Bacilli bacterium]